VIRLYRHDGARLVAADFPGPDSPGEGWSWLDASAPDDIDQLSAVLGFDLAAVADLGSAAFPKTDVYAEFRHVVLHTMAFEDDRITTVAYHAFVQERRLVTFRSGPVYAIDVTQHQVADGHLQPIRSPLELLARIAVASSGRFQELIESLDDRIEDLEDRAMQADASVIGEAQALRRDVIVLRRAFGPQRDLLSSLVRDESIPATARRTLDDAYDHHFRFVESLDAARALLGSVQDTHRGAIAERTNEVMKVLTVFSATMLPLTLIAGIWGMNLAGLPGSSDPTAFRWLLGSMVAIVVVLWVYFVRRGFVGGPRIGRLPKAVGITLAHLGSAPLRAVAGPVARGATRMSRHRDHNGSEIRKDDD